jgi:hypothetical protein
MVLDYKRNHGYFPRSNCGLGEIIIRESLSESDKANHEKRE